MKINLSCKNLTKIPEIDKNVIELGLYGNQIKGQRVLYSL